MDPPGQDGITGMGSSDDAGGGTGNAGFSIPLYVANGGGILGHHPAYGNLLNWAWDDLDDLDDGMAKPIADARADAEIALHGGHTVFGLDGGIVFETQEGMLRFLLKWS